VANDSLEQHRTCLRLPVHLKNRIQKILRSEYPDEKSWKGFIYWWLEANGYDYDIRRDRVNFVDGSGDGGIDVIAWPIETQSRNEVLVLQSKYFWQAPSAQDLRSFETAVSALQGPIDEFHAWLGKCRVELHATYRRLREERRRHRYIVIAPCRFDAGRKRGYRDNNIEVHDVETLGNLERNFTQGRTPRLDELRIPVTSAPRRVAEAAGTRVWIFTAAARALGRAFERHGDVLFAGNIRYALRGQTARRVRSGMFDTLQNHPGEFVFSHNGITVTGQKIRKKHGAVVMESATIVNGAQTISYFGHPTVMKHLARNPAQVIVKFIEVDEAEQLNDIESKVAFRSNNQNKVDPSDLMIELSSLVSLQRYFRRQGVHLERKKGEKKLRFGEVGIAKERLAQVLAAAESVRGAVQGKRKQELFEEAAHRLFGDYDASDAARAEAVAWTHVDDVFRATISRLGNKKRRKRGQLAELASLTVFSRVLKATGLKANFMRCMSRWEIEAVWLEEFLEVACKAILSALLRCSARDRKNEPAFYKSTESVKSAVETATWRSRKKIREAFKRYADGYRADR
jgi:hypothetical protein